MRKLLLLLVLCLPFALSAQKSSRQKKAEKKKEKHEKLLQLIESMEFVIETHTIRDKRGRQSFVSPTTNFVAIADSAGVIQIATNNFAPGLNGLGGQTIQGRITRFEIEDNGIGKGVDIRITFFGLAAFDFFVNISENRYATLYLSGSQGQQLRFIGNIIPLEESDIFVGNPAFR